MINKSVADDTISVLRVYKEEHYLQAKKDLSMLREIASNENRIDLFKCDVYDPTENIDTELLSSNTQL